ncbi:MULTISPECIES: ImmA/IrrE family metallo-endopeptidase [unclassified Enterococcus]|uniref:ImmA/IrrE family metallo-endopeptidase n=1 Tax=unclassified Enterococcus TaxID=2608891 RepID=UPI001CE14C09|nr:MULTISPECIES: ImmA/IrrE family metallo-endopeptidase [unclassified Enterococcus]MCA5013735.1 ImmA/IrrE family metallo-endopeptidase [Enterococcus sp. S23]MCA5016985.1 ImmA/IrrE family metallo-endopeptidase [Enterococcus sp. S22(2020)]
MSEEFLVPTGLLIKEYLEYEGMSQKEFAKRLGSSEKHISNLLNGKTRLTEELALKIEKVLPPTLASYWLNYESKYREYISRKEKSLEYTDVQLKLLSKKFHFKEVFKGLDWSLQKQANEMLKLLRIASFENFDLVYESILEVDFMEDGGSPESIAVWLGLAREEVEIQNPKKIDSEIFSKNKLEQSLKKLKNIALTSNYESSISSVRKLFNRLGVYLVICDPLTNSKVRGALTSYENTPVIYISGRFKTHDNVWFALVHEVGHLLLHYDPEDVVITLDDDENYSKKELEANQFARDFFISPEAYKVFLDNKQNNFTELAIKEFASSQNILPGIVVGRLQHDKLLSYDMFDYLKDRI